MKTSKERFPTPKIVLDWSNSILKKWNRVETQIDAFGTGLQYCLIFHHYHPSKILLSKVFMEPKYPHHFKRNLSIFQESLKNS